MEGVYAEECAKANSRGRMVLNQSNFGEICIRVFEAMGCRRLLLTDELPAKRGLDRFFKDGQHYVAYRDSEDLLTKIRQLKRSPTRIAEIAEAGYREVMASHTTGHRLNQLLDFIEHLKQKKRVSRTR